MHYRSDNIVDKKSKLSDEMPDWWISSRWVPLEESDEENVDDEEFIDLTDRDNNNNRNDNDNDNNNNDNNDNNNASTTTAASSTIITVQ